MNGCAPGLDLIERLRSTWVIETLLWEKRSVGWTFPISGGFRVLYLKKIH